MTPSALQARPPKHTATEGRPGLLDQYFHITERGSTPTREVRGGVTTFMAMAYILLLNPVILAVPDATGATLSRTGLTTATALAASFTTLVMGLVARLPIAAAASLAVSGVVATQVAPVMTWPQAMGLCVVYGAVIMLLVATGLRRLIVSAIPAALRNAIAIGIGLFIALIGLVKAGFVQPGPASAPLEMGAAGHLAGWPVALFCLTLLLIVVLQARGIPGAILIGLIAGSAAAVLVDAVTGLPARAWGGTPPRLPGSAVSAPDFSLLGHVSFGWGDVAGLTVGVIVFTLVLAGFFGGLATMLGVAGEAGLVDEHGRIPRQARGQFIDGAGGAIGGLAGASGQGAFLESAAGVGEGARTGLASVVTGSLFTGCLLLAPLTQLIPGQVAAAALVVIGALMMQTARHVRWADRAESIPVFLTMALIPYTYSITVGIGAGVISHTAIKAAQGKWREPGALMWLLSGVFLLFFASHPIAQLLGGH